MKIIWDNDLKKIVLIVLIILLMVSVYEFAMLIHNFDLAFNLRHISDCDWINADECLPFKNLWLYSFNRIKWILLFIVVDCLLLGLVIQSFTEKRK